MSNAATGRKMLKSMKIIFIVFEEKNGRKYLGTYSTIHDTERNRKKIGREFIPYPENSSQLESWEEKKYIFPEEIKDFIFNSQ